MSKKPENLNTIRQSCGSRVVVNGVSCISPIIDREMYDSSLLYSAAKNKHAKESLVWKPMSEDWKKNCRDEFWFQDTVEEAIRLHPQMDRRLFALKERLLSFAGEAVCLPAYGKHIKLWAVLAWIQCRKDAGRGLPLSLQFSITVGSQQRQDCDLYRVCALRGWNVETTQLADTQKTAIQPGSGDDRATDTVLWFCHDTGALRGVCQ